MCFHVNIVKLLRPSILKNISKRLLKYLILRRSGKSSSNIFFFSQSKQSVFFYLTNVRYILMFFWTWRWIKALFRTIIQGLIICYLRKDGLGKREEPTLFISLLMRLDSSIANGSNLIFSLLTFFLFLEFILKKMTN